MRHDPTTTVEAVVTGIARKQAGTNPNLPVPQEQLDIVGPRVDSIVKALGIDPSEGLTGQDVIEIDDTYVRRHLVASA